MTKPSIAFILDKFPSVQCCAIGKQAIDSFGSRDSHVGVAGHLHTLNLLSVRMYVLLMAVPLEILGQ